MTIVALVIAALALVSLIFDEKPDCPDPTFAKLARGGWFCVMPQQWHGL